MWFPQYELIIKSHKHIKKLVMDNRQWMSICGSIVIDFVRIRIGLFFVDKFSLFREIILFRLWEGFIL